MNISKEDDSTFRLGCLLGLSFVNNIKRDPKDFQGFINLSQTERKRRKLLRRNKQIIFDILLKKKNVPQNVAMVTRCCCLDERPKAASPPPLSPLAAPRCSLNRLRPRYRPVRVRRSRVHIVL